jgi:hypothetical protein
MAAVAKHLGELLIGLGMEAVIAVGGGAAGQPVDAAARIPVLAVDGAIDAADEADFALPRPVAKRRPARQFIHECADPRPGEIHRARRREPAPEKHGARHPRAFRAQCISPAAV